MKKVFFTVVLFLSLCLTVMAGNIEEISYKNINSGDKISYLGNDTWSYANKKSTDYFVKKVSDGTGSYSEFYTPDGEFIFSTGCQYEFIYNGRLIGYSNHDLKFYEFTLENRILKQRLLEIDEINALFKDFEIVRISDFTTSTNSLKINKDKRHFKIILLNDTDRYFYHYGFSSNNAKFATYPLRGFLDITKKGMIQFSHFGDNTKENPWFILLVK